MKSFLFLLHRRKSADIQSASHRQRKCTSLSCSSFALLSLPRHLKSDNVATDEPCWEEVEAFDFVYHEKIYKWVKLTATVSQSTLDKISMFLLVDNPAFKKQLSQRPPLQPPRLPMTRDSCNVMSHARKPHPPGTTERRRWRPRPRAMKSYR
jgi:hypothetical protein